MEIENRQPEAGEAYFALMKIYAAKENHLLVNRHYQELKKIVVEELDVPPSTHITKWYREWEKKVGVN